MMRHFNNQIIKLLTISVMIFLNSISLANIKDVRDEDASTNEDFAQDGTNTAPTTSLENLQAWLNNNLAYFASEVNFAKNILTSIPAILQNNLKQTAADAHYNLVATYKYWAGEKPTSSTKPNPIPSATPTSNPIPNSPPTTNPMPSTSSKPEQTREPIPEPSSPPTFSGAPKAEPNSSKQGYDPGQAAYSANNSLTVKYISANKTVTEMSGDEFMRLVVTKDIDESREALSQPINIRNIQLKLNSLLISNQMLDR